MKAVKEKLEGDSWQLRIGAVFMLIFGIGGLLYCLGLVFTLFAGTVEALLIPIPGYVLHLAVSVLFYLCFLKYGFRALSKPQLPMKKVWKFSDGAWILVFTAVYQVLHLLYEAYLGEGMIIPAVLAAAQLVPPVVYLVEKTQIAEDLRKNENHNR